MPPKKKKIKYKLKDDDQDDDRSSTSYVSHNSTSSYRARSNQFESSSQQQIKADKFEREPQQQIKYKPKPKYIRKQQKEQEKMKKDRNKADNSKKQIQQPSGDPNLEKEPVFDRKIQLLIKQFINLWLEDVITPQIVLQKRIKIESKQSNGNYKYILSGNISPNTEKIWKNYLECYSFIDGEYLLSPENQRKIKLQYQCLLYSQSVVSKMVGLISLEYPNKKIKEIRNYVQEASEHFMIIRTQYEKTVLKFLQNKKLNIQTKAKQKKSHESESDEDNNQSFYQMIDDKGFTRKSKNENKQQQKIETKTKIKSRNLLEEDDDDSRAKLIYTKKITRQQFDKNHFKSWKNNKKYQQLDVHIQEEGDEHYFIKLYSNRRTIQGQNTLINKLKQYTEFKKLLLINESKKDAKQEVENKTSQMAPSGITHKIVEGSWRQKDEQKILKAYLNKEIKNYPNSKKSHGLYLQGLKNTVEEVYETLKSFIEQLPNQNRQVQLYLEVEDKIIGFLKKQQVKGIIEEEIQILLDEYPDYTLKSLLIKFNRISLELQMSASRSHCFQSEDRQKLVNYLKDNHIYKQVDISQPVFNQLSTKYSVFKHPETKKCFLFGHISQINQTHLQINKEIKEMQKKTQKTIPIDKKYFPSAEELVNTLKTEAETSYIDDILIHFDKEKETILLKGPKIQVENIYELISESIEEIKCKTNSTYMVIDRQETLLFGRIQRDKQFDQIQKKFNIELVLHKDYKIGAMINLNEKGYATDQSPLIIYIESGYSMQNIPKNYTFYFRNSQEIQKFEGPITKNIKLKRQKQPKNRQIMHQQTLGKFIFDQTYPERIEEVFDELVEESSEEQNVVAFVMPENNKQQFILDIVAICQELYKNRIRVYIFQSPKVDLQKDLDLKSEPKGRIIEQTHYKFYVEQKGKKFYYSETGNNKIEEAHNKKEDLVYLDNQDVNMQIISHTYNRKSRKVKHLQSGKQYQVKIKQGNMFIVLDDKSQVRFPARQQQKVVVASNETEIDVSLGFYIINLKNMEQINRFSHFKRDLKLEQAKKVRMQYKYNMHVSFDYKINKIQIFYHEQNKDLMNRIIRAIKQKIDEFRVHRTQTIEKPKRVNSRFLEHIKALANQSDVTIEFDYISGQMHYSGIDENYVCNMMSIVGFMIDKLSNNKEEQIKYPEFWVEDQTNQIQTFQVAPNSIQFNRIQQSFTAGKITELLRIQNRHVFKKYHDEKIFLQNQINDGKPIKEKMLFHGTSKTDPKIIYEDRQECFNINYTSDRNLMGKGTYFAEKSEYSVNYSYKETNNSGYGLLNYLGGANEIIRSMFYCMVLVGDSQEIPPNQPQRKDTDYKNPIKKIRYESTTAVLLGSNIFVVYKNRRAYPLYLIKYK